MFNYEVMTEQEAMRERFQLMKDGKYAGTIKSAITKTSGQGNNMIEIDVVVYDPSNDKHNTIRDYWVFNQKMMWKVIHGCNSAGLSKEYEDKMFSEKMLPGRKVEVMIGTKIGEEIPFDKLKGKPPGSKYPDKNVIEDYISRDYFDEKVNLIPNDQSTNDFDDKEIPF